MKARIRRLIDTHLIHPLAHAIYDLFEGGIEQIMDKLDQLQEQIDGLASDLREVKNRADKVLSRMDDLQEQIDSHPDINNDPRLTAISAEVSSLRTAAGAIVPDPPAVTPPAVTPPADPPAVTPPAATPPADEPASDFKAGKDQ